MRETQIWPGWDTVRSIGSGGYGQVYEIRKTDSTGSYSSALKVISIPRSQDEYREYADNGYDDKSITEIFKGQVDDIVSEFKLMAQFKGVSNIVSYEDHMIVPHEDGRGWDILIRMELLTPLPEYINQHGLTEEQAIQMGSDICQALERCAQKGIIHRDIKPQNIFVNEFGDFKLGDFGIARSMDHTTKATKTGTYSYMAPEVYSGKPYGASVDIYSLGLVLYWVLNERRLPFLPLPPAVPTAAQDKEAQMKRLSVAAIPQPKYGSSALKTAVLKACAFSPKDRFVSPEAFSAALDECPASRSNVLSAAAKLNESGGNGAVKPDKWWIICPSCGAHIEQYADGPQITYCGRCGSRIGSSSNGGGETDGPGDTGPIWGPEPGGVDMPEGPPKGKTEPIPPINPGAPLEKETLKAEKKQRRSIWLWAVWMFIWMGGGLGVLLNAFPNPSTRDTAAILLGIPLGIIPFFFKVKRILKESNHNPRVRKTLLISLCVVVGILCLALLGNLVKKQAQNSTSTWSDSSITPTVETQPYTKGTCDGVTYVNDWAGLNFYLPGGFKNASEEYYALYDDENSVECGLFLISDSGEQITICFEQLPYSRVTENIYLDSAISNFAKTAQDQGVSMITDGKDRQDFLIGVEKYTKAQIDLSYENSVQVTESFYVRKIDDRMCCILIVGANGTDNDSLAQLLDGIQRTGDGDNQISDNSTYTKGAFVDGVYTNEWANLKFAIPEGWEIDDDTSDLLESDTIQYGLSTYGDDAQGHFQSCNIYFETLGSESISLTEEAYLDSKMDFIEKAFNIQPDRQYEKTQLGYTFTSAHVYGRLDYDTLNVESMYLCKLGDRMCIIEIVGESREANDQLVSRFTSYN